MDDTKINAQGDFDNVFPSRLRGLMEDNHISQQKLADYLGLKNRQSVAGYCNGRSAPDIESIVKIAAFFSVSTDYLLGVTDDPAPVPTAVDELGLSPKAVWFIKTLYALREVPPHETKRLSLLSYLLEHKLFSWFLANCVWYINLKNSPIDTSFCLTPDYELCEDTLQDHGYTISTSEVQANTLFSEEIIPQLRQMLTDASEQARG